MKTTSPNVILASASPQRKELLENAGIKFKIVESKFDEQFEAQLKPSEIVEKLSLEKAKIVWEKNKDSIIIAADTIVLVDGEILGKPKNEADIKRMLSLLSDNTHSVMTGFTIIDGEKMITKSAETKVTMRTISEKEIQEYIQTKEPFDKAGSYAIQGIAKKFVQKIDGDLSNAIGLPIHEVTSELKKLGIQTP